VTEKRIRRTPEIETETPVKHIIPAVGNFIAGRFQILRPGLAGKIIIVAVIIHGQQFQWSF